MPGLIKNSPDIDTTIIGTSMAGVMRSSEASEILNKKTIKLTINGETLFGQMHVLSNFLDKNQSANTVIWGLDPFYVDFRPDGFEQEYDYPFFLYDETTLNLKYLVNYEVTVHSLQTIASALLGMKFPGKTRNLDDIHTSPFIRPPGCKTVMANFNGFAKMNSRGLERHNIKEFNPAVNPVTMFDQKNAKINLINIVTLAESRKDVQFYIYFPPYSIVRYFFEEEYDGLDRIFQAREFFAKATKDISNIKLIDLQASAEIITNLADYFDMTHHTEIVNKQILNAIKYKQFAGYEDVLENSQRLRELIKSSDFKEIRKCEVSSSQL
ncbi:MAG: hypothetical protein ISR96_11750 [Nitrospira sp.]|nr:hypothetical protein [Nitrospira sp.]